ncbi:MAG: amidohydrolase [Pseudomonadota bacterium]
MLTETDLEELTSFRRHLHQWPEISGEEEQTARKVVEALSALEPTRIIKGLGGHGVAAVFDSGMEGPTVLFRAELDALPITEIHDIPWKSRVPGKGHLCGHEGHMTMLLALGRLLHRQPVARGRVVLMFQPAEEDGSGARAVVADPNFAAIAPDYAFAIHLQPGLPYGHVATKPGLINCASQGLAIHLHGKTAHAADPEDGTSPAHTISTLVPALEALGKGGELNDDFRLATVTHMTMGEPTFGIAPADGTLFVTLRSATDEGKVDMDKLAKAMATDLARKAGLEVCFETHDDFAASNNHPEAVDLARTSLDVLEIPHGEECIPMRASEDFGVFGWSAKAAMLCMGPGEDYAALHNPDYDFPDDIIPIGAALFERIARDLLG